MARIENINIGTSGINVDINMESSFNQKAAWQLYIELSTRIATITLEIEDGDEECALLSIYKIFNITREVLKEKGRECIEIARLSILILNKVIRPFTTKWHGKNLKNKNDFRKELNDLVISLKNYKKQLAHISEIEDFVD